MFCFLGVGKGLNLALPPGLTQLPAWAHPVAKGLQSLSAGGGNAEAARRCLTFSGLGALPAAPEPSAC